MKRALVEAWAHNVLARATRNQPTEDSRVELKREWPPVAKAARLIGAHANAARGEPILWLIGVDQTQGVVGATDEELADWLPGIQKSFDVVAPALISNLVIDTNDGPVVALLFSTDAAPYVVKTGESGGWTYEVPWREGNRTRSALRRDLLTILAPTALLPDIEVVSADVSLTRTHIGLGEHDYGSSFKLRLRLYVAPRSSERITIPRHKCSVTIATGSWEIPLFSHSIQLLPPSEPRTDMERTLAAFKYAGPEDAYLPPSLSIQATQTEAIINGPGFLLVHARLNTRSKLDQYNEQLHVRLSLAPTLADVPVTVTATLDPDDRSTTGEMWWVLR